MSLVILSNTQEEYDETTIELDKVSTNTGIQKPWHFINRLSNAHIIPRFSRVAVQSVKFNRAISFDIKSDSIFTLYQGLQLDDNYAMDQSGSTPIPVVIPNGYYSIQAMANTLQEALNYAIAHPDYYNGALVTLNFDANDIWAGFKFSLGSHSGAIVDKGAAAALTTWTRATPLTADANFAITHSSNTNPLVRAMM